MCVGLPASAYGSWGGAKNNGMKAGNNDWLDISRDQVAKAEGISKREREENEEEENKMKNIRTKGRRWRERRVDGGGKEKVKRRYTNRHTHR